ncbi:TonB-dependent receptor plug domain-containing protein [Luteibaculum oceani]|uniref:TonB-dependent receptor n=1 Tax=Luteibaculum oceani TaxID=1294296 RepID=A0A5C6UWE7_9FLAO|nr:TonB-dependent receptor [Luteibaculum oceani]TXC76984.1 TonB-dependent receptor [Luteibaculum oceani]
MRTALLILLLQLSAFLSAQNTVALNYDKEVLNEVLLELSDRYNFELSINAELSDACRVSVNQNFSNISEAVAHLAKLCGLKLDKVGTVFVITQNPQASEPFAGIGENQIQQEFLYHGVIREPKNGEVLPYSVIQCGNKRVLSDENGRFSFVTGNRKEQLMVHSLGYKLSDTLIASGGFLSLELKPEILQLQEVEVLNGVSPTEGNVASEPGSIQFSDIGNTFVAGQSNNLIFNNLRLYPGVMASGESIGDYVIRGSFSGNNQVLFDGITLFNATGINNDIGTVNPYLVKHLELNKSNFSSLTGDRVENLITITGREGSFNRTEAKLNVTNHLAGGYLNIPLVKDHVNFQLAGRKTYFDFWDLSSSPGEEKDLLLPSYDFEEWNAKLSVRLNSGDRISFNSLQTTDKYEAKLLGPKRRNQVFRNLEALSTQKGYSFNYTSGAWQQGISSVSIAFSSFLPEVLNSYTVDFKNNTEQLSSSSWKNGVEETVAKFSHQFVQQNAHAVSLGVSYTHSSTSLNNILNERVQSFDNSLARVSFFGEDRIQIGKKTIFTPGLRVDVVDQLASNYLQPRLAIQHYLNPSWKMYASWGRYNQFLFKTTTIDGRGNLGSIWSVADDQRRLPLKSNQSTAGFLWTHSAWELNVEGYYKYLSNLQRVYLAQSLGDKFQLGNGEAYGLDVMLRKKLKQHNFLWSYSVGRIQEKFNTDDYVLAAQHQGHEVKFSYSVNFQKFKANVVHVYGSGFQGSGLSADINSTTPYHRTDVAAEYNLMDETCHLDLGFSILNLFNKENIRLNQSVNFPDGDRVNTLGIPFTPTLYLNLSF